MDKSLQMVVGKLEELFSKFNEKFYNNELQKPIIAVSPDTTSGVYGWCTLWKAWKNTTNKDEGYYEINMCAEHLNRPFSEVCATLLHEMVHLSNLQKGVKDVSRGSTYHNKRFKTEAEQRGLIIGHDEKHGWTKTSLNDEAKAFIESLGEKGFQIHRTKEFKISATKKSSSRKYVCPQCGMIVRATKEVHVVCGNCSSEGDYVDMELEE